MVPTFRILAESDEPMFGAARFDSFAQGRGWRRVLAIRGYLHLG